MENWIKDRFILVEKFLKSYACALCKYITWITIIYYANSYVYRHIEVHKFTHTYCVCIRVKSNSVIPRWVHFSMSLIIFFQSSVAFIFITRVIIKYFSYIQRLGVGQTSKEHIDCTNVTALPSFSWLHLLCLNRVDQVTWVSVDFQGRRTTYPILTFCACNTMPGDLQTTFFSATACLCSSSPHETQRVKDNIAMFVSYDPADPVCSEV